MFQKKPKVILKHHKQRKSIDTLTQYQWQYHQQGVEEEEQYNQTGKATQQK